MLQYRTNLGMVVPAQTNLQTWPSCRQSSSFSIDVQGTMHPTVRGTLNIIALQDVSHVNNKGLNRKKLREKSVPRIIFINSTE